MASFSIKNHTPGARARDPKQSLHDFAAPCANETIKPKNFTLVQVERDIVKFCWMRQVGYLQDRRTDFDIVFWKNLID